MKHKVKSTFDSHPYQVITVELIAENAEEEISIRTLDENLQNYLVHSFDTVAVIQNNPPIFVIRCAKPNLGFGN